MRFQNICFLLVVTTNLVSAAPAASAMMEERAAVQPRVKRSPALQQTDFKCSAAGIYADQETGCQVFHICQDGGRMDSFFCPNLTLFNQRFFVCDWSYNVDCQSAHLYFDLNSALYPSPETISNAIKPAIRLAQDEILSGSQPSVVRSLSPQPPGLQTSSSQLDAHIVVDNSLSTHYSQTKPIREEIPQVSQEDSAPLIYFPETTTAAGNVESSSLEAVSVPDPPVSPYYDDVADPEPAAGEDTYVSAPLPTYNSVSLQEKSLVYDDADPEPADYLTGDLSDPEPESYPSYNSPSYYGSDSLDLTGSQSVAQSVSQPVYLDDTADPEPAGYDPYVVSDNNYQGLYYDPSTDPEPSADPEFTPYDS